MSMIELTPRRGSDPGPATRIDDQGHPALRRVADVLRSRAATPRTLLLDDADSIDQAALSGVRVESIYSTPKHAEEATGLRDRMSGADQFIVAEDTMRSLLPRDNASRVLALARAPRPARWADLAAASGDVLVLDGVRITGNVGAIIRSASALGASGVVLVDSGLGTAFDRRLVRASRGLVFALPTLLADRDDVVSFLSTTRMPLLGLAADAQAPLEHISRRYGRAAILLGSERFGPSEQLEAAVAARYSIPMEPGVESLNVSVAAALALYERR
ncbi:TrmH family RNA methyltransferase [Microbacterium sp. NPDC057650]|uniref:TrmH family RNA methyltransferase n=1 Tax=unclassified Microbacterium TaxID=2609290 RepID=UPI00366C1BE2